MKIDFHTHCFPDRLAGNAIKKLSEMIDQKPFFDGTLEGLKARLIKAGIDAAVICNIATNERQVRAVNDFAIAACGGNLTSFGSIHPKFADYKSEINRLCDAGIKGVKFHPDYQNYFVDDESVYPVYEYAAGKGMILHFHTGLDLGIRGVVKAPPDRFLNVIEAFPGAKLVAAHMGGYAYADLSERLLAGRDFYMDTSATLCTMAKRQAERVIKKHGADKILFGTDMPWFSPEKDIRFIDSLSLSPEEKEKIYHKNAEKLLGIGRTNGEGGHLPPHNGFPRANPSVPICQK